VSRRGLRRAFLGALALGLAVAACVIPDRDILIVTGAVTNRYAVRVVEPTRLTAEAEDACDDPDTEVAEKCPQPPPEQTLDVLPHFLDPRNPIYAFCACPTGQEDSLARPNFGIYVEDRDEDSDRDIDDIYAALLLDPDPQNPAPQTAVRYRLYVNPQDTVPLAASIDYDPIGNRVSTLRELRLGNEFRDFDFCNGASDEPLDEGYHSVVVMVTDRPWFTPEDGPVQEGVPDLASGATFDTLTYVFACGSTTSSDAAVAARCVEQCKPIEETP